MSVSHFSRLVARWHRVDRRVGPGFIDTPRLFTLGLHGKDVVQVEMGLERLDALE